MITKNAKDLVALIGGEYVMQVRRAENGYIAAHKITGCTLECLKAKAKSNKDLAIFLETIAYIHPHDDEYMNRPWAEDPREPDPVTGVRPEREQRSRDDDIGLVPAAVHSVPSGA